MTHSPTPWCVSADNAEVWDFDGCLVADCAEARIEGELVDQTNAQRIVACVNACKDITTEHLTQFPNWKLAVGNMARPGDVANLILKLGAYREMMAKLVEQARHCNFIDEYGHLLTMNTAYQAIEEALK